MINEFAIPGPRCGKADPRPMFILGVHYLYFAILLAGITVVIAGSVSLLTPPIDRRYLYRLTWWSRFTTAKRLDVEAESIARKRQKHKLNPEKFPDPDREDDVNETNPILKCLGIGKKEDSKEAREAEEIARQNYDPLKSIQENKNWNIVANVLAVFSIELFVFLNAYYA